MREQKILWNIENIVQQIRNLAPLNIFVMTRH